MNISVEGIQKVIAGLPPEELATGRCALVGAIALWAL